MSPTTVTTRMIDGRGLRDAALPQVAAAVQALGQPVRLTIVQVGEDAASAAYVRNKMAACAKVGILGDVALLQPREGEAALHSVVRGLAEDPQVHAVLVQTPLPQGWNVQAALDLVPAVKDVDGLSRASIALRRAGDARALLPATPLGVMRLLAHEGVDLQGCAVAVIGKGMVVGAPLREMLEMAGAEVIGIDKDTPQPARLSRAAEVVVSAAGVPGLVDAAWVKPGALVLDVGLTRVEGNLRGDVDRASVEGVARAMTPAPGGVGPLTVVTLLMNVVDAACLQTGKPRVEWRF